MATAAESLPRSLRSDGPDDYMGARTVPIMKPTMQMSAPSPGEPMEITTPTNSSAPHSANKSPESDANGLSDHTPPASSEQTMSENMMMPAPAAAAVHQPKIVQTAFIHKLYNMLEDKSIQHMISWTPSAESFVMQPSQEFSKVLAQYFKHTNISSFVRQLNMYGFHKVSDVFHSGGAQDATLWEFKHGNGNFRRGDLSGLREIKRRASRHALVHREYRNQKPPPSQPGTPAELMAPMPEGGGGDPRGSIEHTIYELSARVQRGEENAHFMQIKQHAILDTVSRLLQYNRDLSRAVLALAPAPDNPIHQDVANLQLDIQRQMEMFRSLEESHEPLFANRGTYFASVDNAPISPRQLAQDDARRSSVGVSQPRPPNHYRPAVPSNLSASTRRPYGSMCASATQPSPVSLRAPAPAPPPGPHPLVNVELPPGSLTRRHTSADIRAHGWQAHQPPAFQSGPPSTQWPSSPNRAPAEDQRLRDSFSHYSLHSTSHDHSRPTTPPLPPYANGGVPLDFGSWSWNKANRGENRNLNVSDGSAPPTRRGSMAHILNPTDTAERDDEDETLERFDPRGEDDRKRKRLQ